MTDVKMIRIDCPICSRFLCYVRADSDVFCPRCQQFIYMGLNSTAARADATNTAQS